MNPFSCTAALVNLVIYISLFNKRSVVSGDGVQYLSDLLDVIRKSSADNAAALRKLQPGPGETSASPSSPDGDSDDSVARARRYVALQVLH